MHSSQPSAVSFVLFAFFFWVFPGLVSNKAKAAGVPQNIACAHPLKPGEAIHLKGDMIRLADFGTDDVAYLTLPSAAPVGGIVLLHEWWGLNSFIKGTADRLAEAGFVVVAVDLYNGQIATDPGKANELMNNLDLKLALKTAGAAVRFLHESPRFRCEKVGTLGWCMGGGVSLQTALNIKDVDACVVYYGPTETDEKKVSKLHTPLLGIYAKRDEWIKPIDVEAFDALLTKLGKQHEFHSYDAVHAFANPSNAKYQDGYAEEAWNLSINFLKQTFSAPPKKNVIDKIFN